MLYKRLIINGEEYLLAVNQTGQGAPTENTVGAPGVLYMDTDTEKFYKCTAAIDGVYTWKEFETGGSGGSNSSQNVNQTALGVSITDFPRLDGETDDSPRIQRAFNTLPDKEADPDGYYQGFCVYFPAGAYEIATTVTGVNVGIIGDTGTVFKGLGTGYMFDISFDGELGFAHVSGGAEIYQWRNFPVEKCVFNGNGKMNGIKHSGGHNISIRDSVFCDTVECGYYIASGSKYLLDHVTFRGVTDDTSLNQLAVNLGGSDHNVRNVIIANYTKGINVAAACTFLDQCHMWLNHNDRIASSYMFTVSAGKCVITNAYIDTVKIGIKVNTSDTLTVNNINGYNNPVFSLSGAVYISANISGKLFVSGAQINDTKSAYFINISEDNCPDNIKLIGIRGDCSNVYETYGARAVVTIPCTGLTLDKTELTFATSESQQLTATVTPENTTDAVVWSSDDSAVATVSSSGVVKPKSNGTCNITATCGEYSSTCAVTISGVAFDTDTSWDAEWNAGDDSLPSFLDTSTMKVDGDGYISTAETGKKAVFTYFTGGEQIVEIEACATVDLTSFAAGSIQIMLLDGTGTGHKLLNSGMNMIVKGTEYSVPIVVGEWFTAKAIYKNGVYSFYINDELLAENQIGYSDEYIAQAVQVDDARGAKLRAIRFKAL